MSPDNTEKSPLDRAVELLVYAPIGAALTARELLPNLVERGRQQVNAQVNMARMLGQFAVRQGQTEIEKNFSRARDQAMTTLRTLGVVAPERDGRTPGGPSTAPQEPPPRHAPPSRPTSGPGAGNLAIPDYDSLSASQVVPRLAALSGPELDAVRGYEAAHRGRKTILHRISQLQGG